MKTAVVPDVLIRGALVDHGPGLLRPARQFPAKYRDGAFAALRGSSDRTKRTGYKVVFLPFAKGQATGDYDDFVIGWMLGEDKPEVWGRPVGLTVLKDGSMLVTDDGANKVWKVTYGRSSAARVHGCTGARCCARVQGCEWCKRADIGRGA